MRSKLPARLALAATMLGACGPASKPGSPNAGIGPPLELLLAITSTGDVTVGAIAFDAEAGDVVIAGSFSGTLALLDARATSAGSSDAFIARISRGGAPRVRWLRRFGGAGDDRINAIVSTSQGFAFGGDTHDRFEIDDKVVIGAGEPDGFVGVIADDGEMRWIETMSASLYSSVLGIAVTSSGDIAASGYYAGALAIVGRPLYSAGGQDAFAARFRASGGVVWVVRAGGPGSEIARAIVGTDDGGVIIAGSVMDGAQIGEVGFEIDTPTPDLLVAAIDSDGNHRWATSTGGARPDSAAAIARGGNEVIVGGRVEGADGPIALYRVGDAGELTPARVGVDAIDISALAASTRAAILGRVRGATRDDANLPMLIELRELDGEEVWRKTVTADGALSGRAIAIDPSGRVAVAGQFRGKLQLGARTLTSAPDTSAFIAVFED